MAGLVVITLVIIVMGASFGVLLRISFAIRREDRSRGSLRLDAPNNSVQTARSLGGLTSSRWDYPPLARSAGTGRELSNRFLSPA